MFEPVHGSAPDIVGQGIANPIGAIGSTSLMLDHLGHAELGCQVRDAIAGTIRAGVLTADLGGTATTPEVTDSILARLASPASVG